MGWLFLGLTALPLAAVLYAAFERLTPRLLEPVPEPALHEPDGGRQELPWRGRRYLSRQHMTIARAVVAVAALLVIVLLVEKRQAGPGAPVAAPVQTAAGIALPPPVPLQVQLRFGGDGAGDGQLHDPRDVAVDASGNVYVADTGNKRIVKFRPDGAFAGQWTSSAKGAFAEPSSLAIAKDGVIVDDSETAQLHKFDFNGQPVVAFEHDLALSHPRGISIGPDGMVYVGDTANSRILKVAGDGSPLGAFDTKGVKLEQPTGVTVDEQGSVYSLEPAASRIQKFAADGTLQASFFLPSAITVYPPRAAWLPSRGLVASLPDQNELVTYGPAGAPEATFVPQPNAAAPAPRKALGLAAAPDSTSVWVVWNGTANVTQLAWPS